MPTLATSLAALALAAASLPFPAPRLVAVTEKTKCDMGTVVSVDSSGSTFKIRTPAGIVTYRAGPDVQVFGKDGKPAGAVSRLAAGENVRVYYVVDDGARAAEVDLE